MAVQLPDVSLGDDALEFHVAEPQPRKPTAVPMDKSAVFPESLPASGDLVVVEGDLDAGDLDGDRMSGAEHAWVVLCHWFRQAVESAQEAIGTQGGIGAAQPESWVQYRARVKARGWLPEGHSGGWLEWFPVAWHHTIGPFGFVFFGVGQWLATHPLAFMIAFFLTVISIVLWLCLS